MVAVLRVLRQEHADLARRLDMVEAQLGGVSKSCLRVPACASPFASQGRIESTRAAQSRRTSSSGGAFQLVSTKWFAR